MRLARHTHIGRTCEPPLATNYDYRADNRDNNYDIVSFILLARNIISYLSGLVKISIYIVIYSSNDNATSLIYYTLQLRKIVLAGRDRVACYLSLFLFHLFLSFSPAIDPSKVVDIFYVHVFTGRYTTYYTFIYIYVYIYILFFIFFVNLFLDSSSSWLAYGK